MTATKDSDGYPTAPRRINGGGWFYEQRSGIIAYHDGEHRVALPWRMLTAAVDRHRRIKAKRKS